MIRQIRNSLDRGWTMGVAAVVLVVAAIGATSVVASAADLLAPAVAARPAYEAVPASETPYGLQSWPHGTCVDSREVEAYSLGCNGGAFQRYRMHLVPQGDFVFQLVDVATGWCLDSKPGGEVVTSQCSDSSLTQAWTLDAGHRDSDGRAVMHYLNRGTNLWLALGLRWPEFPSGQLDVYATGDATTFDRDFAIQW